MPILSSSSSPSPIITIDTSQSNTKEDEFQDCLSCRILGATTFAGLGIYTYISGHRQINAAFHKAELLRHSSSSSNSNSGTGGVGSAERIRSRMGMGKTKGMNFTFRAQKGMVTAISLVLIGVGGWRAVS